MWEQITSLPKECEVFLGGPDGGSPGFPLCLCPVPEFQSRAWVRAQHSILWKRTDGADAVEPWHTARQNFWNGVSVVSIPEALFGATAQQLSVFRCFRTPSILLMQRAPCVCTHMLWKSILDCRVPGQGRKRPGGVSTLTKLLWLFADGWGSAEGVSWSVRFLKWIFWELWQHTFFLFSCLLYGMHTHTFLYFDHL